MFLIWPTPASFLFILVLFIQKFYRKSIGFSVIQTQIVGVEGEHADHLTTITVQLDEMFDSRVATNDQ